ncbi:CsiV family protein [Coxiella-like endosymbiont]|uniref:CsiV family protein n=1 Tax=Coxiella-like endosymbiont TaxID=1592897 RepID=UPI00272B1614|nr:CsiV family protein [Coxiella-like endosymbiont]
MKWFLILLFITLSPILTAEAKVYQIEMIVFLQPTSQNNGMEEWSTSSPSDLNFLRAKQIRTLPVSQFLLKNEQTKLNENLRYHTLLHLAWQQSITHLPTRPMRIEGNGIQGLFRVNVQRYFNISLALLFNQPNGSNWYAIQERRMRSNQLNYLDFVYYGILIKISSLT